MAGPQHEHNAHPSVQPQSSESLKLCNLVYLTSSMACQKRKTETVCSVWPRRTRLSSRLGCSISTMPSPLCSHICASPWSYGILCSHMCLTSFDGLPDETDEEGSLCLIGADQAVLRVELQHANKAQCPVQPQRLHGFSQPRRRWHIDDIPTA